ncbi:MAG TPA: GNAT family N-acetyltransferase [Pseudogracilibacillus sp.]|nr:GNAT family N-acetyltransferase [Pseudogracilibacillus sp.]
MAVKIIQTEKELNDAYDIRKQVFVDEQQVPMDLEIDEFEQDAMHFLYVEDNIPVGASRLRFVEHAGKLERICVLPAYRGKGYSKELIQTMEDEIVQREMDKAVLHAQIQVTPLYESVGYEIVSDEFMDAGIPHVEMTKKL